MKNLIFTIIRPFCRLLAAALWQAVWLVPVWVGCWYGKSALPRLVRAHFGVDQAQEHLDSLKQFADTMKSSVSLTNPSALIQYLSAQLSKFSASAKLNTIEITSNIMQTLCVWGLNLLWIAALFYAVIRTLRVYREKSQTFDIATTISQQLHAQLALMQEEIVALRAEIQDLKGVSLSPPDQKHEAHLLPDE